MESFETDISLPFLASSSYCENKLDTFHGVFIRAPIVEKVLPTTRGVQVGEEQKQDTIVAPAYAPKDPAAAAARAVGQEVEVMGLLPGRADALKRRALVPQSCEGDIIVVRQGNCFGTSFHPELTNDDRIHVWWLNQIRETACHDGPL